MKPEKKIGNTGELFAAQALVNLGIEQLEQIGTPVKVFATPQKGLFRVIWGKKVIGDFRGVLPGGRSVISEVKTILHHNLGLSDFKEHQPAGLSRHAELGGLSLVVWVHGENEIYIMEWTKDGIPGLAPRHALTPEQANELTKHVVSKAILWNLRREPDELD